MLENSQMSFYSTAKTMYFAVGFDFCITLPGLPTTIQSSGTSKFTKAPGAIKTLFPIVTPPIITEFAFMQTLSPMTGTPEERPREFPIRHPWLMLKFLPIWAPGLITIVPKCKIRNPFPIFVLAGIWIPVLNMQQRSSTRQKNLVRKNLALEVFLSR